MYSQLGPFVKCDDDAQIQCPVAPCAASYPEAYAETCVRETQVLSCWRSRPGAADIRARSLRGYLARAALVLLVDTLLLALITYGSWWLAQLLHRLGTAAEEARPVEGGFVDFMLVVVAAVSHFAAIVGILAAAVSMLYTMANGIVAGVYIVTALALWAPLRAAQLARCAETSV